MLSKLCCSFVSTTHVAALRWRLRGKCKSLKPVASQQAASYAFHKEMHEITSRLNSMHGPPSPHPEDIGELVDTVLPSGLQLMKQTVHLPGQTIRLVVPRSVDAVMDTYIAAGQYNRDPYWCRVWPSALALAQLILQHPKLVAGKSVCDIGSGLGLAGIAAALAGAKEVVMLDYEPMALQCSLLSAEASGVTSVQDFKHHGADATPSSAEVQHPATPQQVSEKNSRSQAGSSSRVDCQVRAELLDWSADLPQRQHEVALGCDVLYAHASVEAFSKAVPKLLNKASGILLLADPSDRTKENREKFLELVANHKERPAIVKMHSTETIHMDGQDTSVELFEFEV